MCTSQSGIKVTSVISKAQQGKIPGHTHLHSHLSATAGRVHRVSMRTAMQHCFQRQSVGKVQNSSATRSHLYKVLSSLLHSVL